MLNLYRAWPWRPHCRSAAGYHTWLCRLALPVGLSTKCYHEHHDR